jgi:hypothetical protein
MKRILALLLAMIMTLSLCACGNNTADNTDGGTTANTESSTTGTEDTTGNTEKPDETTSATDSTEESTSATEGTQTPTEDTKPTEKPTEQTKPTGGNKPTGSTTPTTTPPTTETKECQHLNAFNVPNDDASHPVPTCTEDGYYLRYCPDCNKQWHEKAQAVGHKIMETPYDNGYVAATCCKEGQTGAKEYCYVCKTILKEGDVLPKVYYNHIGETYIINKVEQTWTQAGYSGDTCCDGCKSNILPENKGSTVPAEKDCPWATKSYSAERDKIKCECSRHNYAEYREPDPISIQSIEVVRTLSTPGDGVKMVGFTVTGGSFDYSADFEVISDKQYMLNRFYIEKAEASSIWDFHILLNDGYYIPDGTQLKIMITDSSGRTFSKTYTVRCYAWNDYDVV